MTGTDLGNEVQTVGQYPPKRFPIGINRRDFLKITGVAFAGVAAAVALPACNEAHPTSGPHIIESGNSLFFTINGGQHQTIIQYDNCEIPITRLVIPLENGQPKPLKFESSSQQRFYGEVLDCSIQQLQKNTSIPDDVDIHYYPIAEPLPSDNKSVRKVLPTSSLEGLCGIPVITDAVDAMRDLDPSTKPTIALLQMNNTKVWAGKGWAIGHLDKGIFKLQGYVDDMRVFASVK